MTVIIPTHSPYQFTAVVQKWHICLCSKAHICPNIAHKWAIKPIYGLYWDRGAYITDHQLMLDLTTLSPICRSQFSAVAEKSHHMPLLGGTHLYLRYIGTHQGHTAHQLMLDLGSQSPIWPLNISHRFHPRGF